MKSKEKRVDNIAVQGDYYSRPVPSGDTIIEPKRSTSDLSEALDFLSRHGAPKTAIQTTKVERLTAPSDLNDENELARIFSRADALAHANKGGNLPKGTIKKEQITVRLDGEVVNWLKSKGPRHNARINGLLRALMERDVSEPN